MRKILAHEIVHHTNGVANSVGSRKTVFVLHGMLGSGKNLRTLSKTLSKQISLRVNGDMTSAVQRASMSPHIHQDPHDTSRKNTENLLPLNKRQIVENTNFVLVDLPGHGESKEVERPYNLDNCASYIKELADHLSKSHGFEPPNAVIGHSFGGKAALAYLEKSVSDGWVSPNMTFVLDALPSKYFAPLPVPGNSKAHEESVVSVLEEISKIRIPIASKAALLHHLHNQLGYSNRLSQWMATNLRPIADNNDPKYGFKWTFDLDIIQSLFRDHQNRDFWPFLRSPRMSDPNLWKGEKVNVIRAEKNRDLWTKTSLAYFPQFGGPEAPAVTTALLHGAGHWMHSDRPNELVDIIVPDLLEALAKDL